MNGLGTEKRAHAAVRAMEEGQDVVARAALREDHLVFGRAESAPNPKHVQASE